MAVEYTKKIKIGRLTASINYRPKSKNPMGRFGGCWDWELGFQVSSSFTCVIVNCFIFYIRFDYAKIR